MADRFSSLIPNDNIYVIATASDLPQVVDRWRLYHLLYDPGDGVGLYYSPDAINLVRISAGGGSGGIDPGTVDGSTTYWDVGSVSWAENTLVKWIDPDYLELGAGIAVNWIDGVAVSQELLILALEPVSSVPIDYYSFQTNVDSVTASQTYVNTANGLNQSQAGMIDGDLYAIIVRAAVANQNSSASAEEGFRVTIGGTEMSYSEQLAESLGLTPPWDSGPPYGYLGFFTADVAGGNIRTQHKRGTGGTNDVVGYEGALIINITQLPNHELDTAIHTAPPLEIWGVDWIGTGASVSLSLDTWIIWGAAWISGFTGANRPGIALDASGSGRYQIAGRVVEDSATDAMCQCGGIILENYSGVVEVDAWTGTTSPGGDLERAAILAIPLSDFLEGYAAMSLSQTPQEVAAQSVPEDILTESIASIVNTSSNFFTFGFSTTEWSGTQIATGFQINENINSGGAVGIGWNDGWKNRKTTDTFNWAGNNMWSAAGSSYTAGDQVDITIQAENTSPSFGSHSFRQYGVALVDMNTAITFTSKFFVGDPAIPMQLDASELSINGAYTLPIADGTAGQFLATDGAGVVTFTSGLFLPAGTVTGSHIYWDGAAWVENTVMTWLPSAPSGPTLNFDIDSAIAWDNTIHIAKWSTGGGDADFGDVTEVDNWPGVDGQTTGTTTFGRTLQFDGGCEYSNGEFFSAPTSLFGDGIAGSRVRVLGSSEPFLPGTGDWTIECHLWPLESDQGPYMGVYGGSNDDQSWRFWSGINDNFEFDCWGLSSGLHVLQGGNNSLVEGSIAGWQHAAIVRDGNTLRMFVDGVELDTDNTMTSDEEILRNATAVADDMMWFFNVGSSINYYDGYLDNFRFTKGTARYTSGFTPPSAGPYATNGIGFELGHVSNPTIIYGESISISNAYTLPLVDGTAGQALITDGAGVVSFATAAQEGIQGLGLWRYRTETGTPPASGQLRFDNVDISSATEFYLNETNDGGFDVSVFLDLLLVPGAIVYMQDRANAANAALIEIGTVVDSGTYRTVQIVNIIEEGTEPSQNQQVAIFIGGNNAGGFLPVSTVTDSALVGAPPNWVENPLVTLAENLIDQNNSALTGPVTHILRNSGGGVAFNVNTTTGDAQIGKVDSAGAAESVWMHFRRGGALPDVGFIEGNTPVTFNYDTFSNTTPAQQFLMTWTANPTVTSNYIGGCLSTAVTFDITTGVFIPAIFSDTNRYEVGAAPGFSAITFINELSVVANNGNFNLPSALVVNVGLTHARESSGTSTSPGTTGFSFSPQTRATVSGAVMTKTDQTALRCSPTFSTVGGSTANLGTIRGLHCFNPAVALFQPGSGAETMTAYYGVDVNNITFGGTAEVAAVRSNVSPGTNQYFMLNNGNAVSDFGIGHIYFDDNAGVAYGGVGVTTFDVWQSWNATGYFRTFFLATSSSLRWSSPVANRFLFDSDGAAVDGEYNFNCAKFSLGAQTGAVGNQVGVFAAGTRSTQVGGEWADFLLTQAANITVDHAMGGVFGWAINAPTMTIGTGSVTTAGALTVGGNVNQGSVNRFGVRIISNPTGGSGVNAALWVTAGRSQFDGFVDINKPVALGGGAAATLGTIGGAGPTAAAQAQWVEIEINGVRHWIPAWT